MFKTHTVCRVCGSEKLSPYLDLGLMPLSNNLLTDADEVAPRYPLKVLLCEGCGLSQLSVVIDPVELFGHYVYRSSIAQGYKQHCREMAYTLKDRYGLSSNSFHIDIAGNDGALLAEFKRVLGHKTLNVDPAKNLAAICEAQGIRAFQTFWGYAAARHLLNTDWPLADLVTATNVYAHVDDPASFLEAIKLVLAPKGVAVIEFPYLIDFIEKNEFDTVYFEHLSYFSIYPLSLLCKKAGLVLHDVGHYDIHGGSVRCYITRYGTQSDQVQAYINKEAAEGYRELGIYKNWAVNVSIVLAKFMDLMRSLAGMKVYGFAASAKGNTLLNCAGVSVKQMPYIIDQTPEKIGKYSPGTGIPIAGMDRLIEDQPDFLVILSWNFFEEIVKKCRQAGYRGNFVNPLMCEISV